MTRSLTGQSVCQGIVCDHDRSALTKRSVSNIYVSACDDISNGFKQFLDGCPMVRISGPGSCRYSAGDAGSRELRTRVLSRVSWSGPRTSQSGFDRNGYVSSGSASAALRYRKKQPLRNRSQDF
jgi:hypothetical protein